MGRKSPRISRGASGFMSHKSMCDGPPLSQIRIVDLALPLPVVGAPGPAGSAPALASARSESPQKPIPPAARKTRRFRTACSLDRQWMGLASSLRPETACQSS